MKTTPDIVPFGTLAFVTTRGPHYLAKIKVGRYWGHGVYGVEFSSGFAWQMGRADFTTYAEWPGIVMASSGDGSSMEELAMLGAIVGGGA